MEYDCRDGKILERQLSRHLRNKALISPSGDYGWKKADTLAALGELGDLNFAVMGCEVWAVETERDDKVLDVFDELFLTVKNVYIDMLPCRNGKEELFNFSCDRNADEAWQAYVSRSIKETEAFVNSGIESKVADELENHIFYNPVFIDEEASKNWKQVMRRYN